MSVPVVSRCSRALAAILACSTVFASAAGAQVEHRYLELVCRDAQTGALLPGVELTTKNGIVHRSDANGVIAFYEPGLMGGSVFFRIARPGYAYAPSGFPIPGGLLPTIEGSRRALLLSRVSGETDERTFPVADSRFAEEPVLGPEGVFAIFVVDAETGRPVPLAEIASPHRVDETDDFGAVAFDDRDVLGSAAEFRFSAHGYTFSEPVRTLFAAPGGSVVIPAVRRLAAERIYRITGAGQYRHAAILGLEPPVSHPLLNASVMGQDTALGVVFSARIHWFWGDTSLAGIGAVLRSTGATSALPGPGGTNPEVGIDLDYFTSPNGVARAVAPFRRGAFTWLTSAFVARDGSGAEALYARFANMLDTFTPLESGLARWDEESGLFAPIYTEPGSGALPRAGRASDLGDGYVHFGPTVRVAADERSLVDASQYEVYTPFQVGGGGVERDAQGRAVYRWRRGGTPVGADDFGPGLLSAAEDLRPALTDPDSGEAVAYSEPRVAWNEHRRRYIWIANQVFGDPSFLGESGAPSPDDGFDAGDALVILQRIRGGIPDWMDDACP